MTGHTAMYDVVWDPETGGILLKEVEPGGLKSVIRPVFHEELDLLGFGKKWRYPQSKGPLLWATTVGRRYFYRGEWVATANGGSFSQPPSIHYLQENLELIPVDVPAMLARNADLMRNLVQKTIAFIRQTHDQEGRWADIAAVAFSGGKDSLVLLDLVQRTLRPEQFVVVFNDTQMEITPTYEAVAKARKLWPHLRFHKSCSHKPPEQTWREFGPPSRIHRWCCSVHKTVPNLLLLRQLTGNPAARVLIYDGVRWEESHARAGYAQITVGGKHGTQINVSPILKWNSAEIFLYLLDRNILLNNAYRYGLTRVGCSVCPMASDWSGSIYKLRFYNDCYKLLNILEEYNLIDTWKSRAGGRDISGTEKVSENKKGDKIEFVISNPAEKWTEWAKTLGRITHTDNGTGKIRNQSIDVDFNLVSTDDAMIVTLSSASTIGRSLLSRLRAIAQKTAYCVHCKTCEVECPAGAISINNHVNIDENKCRHCHQCLKFKRRGCLVSKSLQITKRWK